MFYGYEPAVQVERERERVRLFVVGETEAHNIALAQPVSSEECDRALAWAERMEAALDNYVSAIRLIQVRMEAASRTPNWHDPRTGANQDAGGIPVGPADPSLGAGGSVEAYRG